MKPYFILSIILVIIMMILPIAAKIYPHKNYNQTEKSTSTITIIPSEETDEIGVFRSDTGKVNGIDMTEYVIGTVAGEMPASFNTEALKAQAVASYTYAKYIIFHHSADENNAIISDSYEVHQNYIDKEKQKAKWGDSYEENRKRIEQCVKEVSGQYLSYEGEPALTVFHAISYGKTKSSDEAFGKLLPYLSAVEAPGDILSEKYETTVTVTKEEFKTCFEEKTEINFTDDNHKNWASVEQKNDEGYIDSLKVCSKVFTAYEIRTILNLPGSSFKCKIEGENFVFTVHGKGHGVGMSQYSADFMARQGADYKEILAHFYPGTTLSQD